MRQMKGVGFTFPPITPPTKSKAIASSTSSSAINERRTDAFFTYYSLPVNAKHFSFQYWLSYILVLMIFSIRNCGLVPLML